MFFFCKQAVGQLYDDHKAEHARQEKVKSEMGGLNLRSGMKAGTAQSSSASVQRRSER